MLPLLDLDPAVDPAELARVLWQHRIGHRIIDHEGRRVLMLGKQEEAVRAHELYLRLLRGEEIPPPARQAGLLEALLPGAGMGTALLRALQGSPLTLLLVLACIVLYLLAPLQSLTRFDSLAWSLLYPDFAGGTRVIDLARVWERFTVEQFLRMISPILLHGGVLHLVFNMLWLWELGKRIELRQGTLAVALVVVVLALLSNTAQYLYGGGNRFGGMSGVVYGLFAYVWMWQLIQPAARLGLPRALLVFMLLSLVAMTALQLEMIANEAHLGGFGAGLLIGLVSAAASRLKGVRT